MYIKVKNKVQQYNNNTTTIVEQYLDMNNTNNASRQFKNTYSSTTVIILVGVLGIAFICVYIYNEYKAYTTKLQASKKLSPPSCPNYWDSLGDGKCQNTHHIGSCSNESGADVMDFSGQVFTNKNTGEYAKCRWAKSCNVSWSAVDRLC